MSVRMDGWASSRLTLDMEGWELFVFLGSFREKNLKLRNPEAVALRDIGLPETLPVPQGATHRLALDIHAPSPFHNVKQ